MLSFDAWRACRLVVDTGIHAMGWTRQQAIDYLTANTVLAPNNIANEVDRYITWPGQALAYNLGQIEILALRDEARQKLGPKFDIRAFHDVVLRNGAVALPVLRHEVEVWIESAPGRLSGDMRARLIEVVPFEPTENARKCDSRALMMSSNRSTALAGVVDDAEVGVSPPQAAQSETMIGRRAANRMIQ